MKDDKMEISREAVIRDFKWSQIRQGEFFITYKHPNKELSISYEARLQAKINNNTGNIYWRWDLFRDRLSNDILKTVTSGTDEMFSTSLQQIISAITDDMKEWIPEKTAAFLKDTLWKQKSEDAFAYMQKTYGGKGL